MAVNTTVVRLRIARTLAQSTVKEGQRFGGELPLQGKTSKSCKPIFGTWTVDSIPRLHKAVLLALQEDEQQNNEA
jgi:hypothetical protein